MKQYFYILILVCNLLSCKEKHNPNYETLNKIENLLLAHADSALIILNSMSLTPNDAFEQNKYFLYRIIAKDKTDHDIYMDKEILDVYDYYKKNDNNRLTYISAFYCGKVFQANKEYDQAIKYYNIAENTATTLNDREFKAEILYTMSRLLIEQSIFDDAKEKLIQAKAIFKETGNYKYEIKAAKLLGYYYLMTDDLEASLTNYEKARNIAIQHNDAEEEALIEINIGVIQHEKGNYKAAIETFKQAINTDSIALSKAYINLAESYSILGILDSARHYAGLSIKIINENPAIDNYTQAGIYSISSTIEENAHNYVEALNLHKSYSYLLAKMVDETQGNAMIDAQHKYKYEKVQKENNELLSKNIKTQRFLFFALLFIALLVILYNRKMMLKDKQLIKANDEILQLTDQAKENIKENRTTEKSYREHLTHNLNILKRAATLEYHVQDSGNKQGKTLIKSFNTIAYGKESIDWSVLYNVINSVYNGFFDQMKERHTELDDTEFRICCLIYSKFNSNEIAVITGLSINTVHMKTTYIRKKLKIKKYGNIIDYFNNSSDNARMN